MSLLQYKEESKCKIAVVIVAAFLLFAYYMDGGSIITGFKGMENIWLYVFIRDILPATLVLAIGVLVLIKKISPKLVLGLLSGFFASEILGQFVLLSSEKVYFGFLFTTESVVKVVVNILAIVFTIMVLCGGLKASNGSFCTTLAKGILIFFNIYVLSSFLITTFGATLAMFVLSGVEDYEEKPMKKIKGEKIGFARRNVGSCIILTIMTCGIFGIIWLVKICKDIGRLHGDENPVGSEVLLYLFVPFYSVYWGYNKGKQMYEDSQKRGGNLTDRKHIYLFMNLIFMQLFTLGFIQTQLNMYQSR